MLSGRCLMLRKTILVPSLLALLLACRTPAVSSDPVILRLGDQEVRKSDFDRYVAAIEKQQEGTLAPDVRAALLTAFLENRLLVLEARTRGLVAAGADENAEQAAVEQLIAAEVNTHVEVPEAEVAAYFEQHKNDFEVPEKVVVRQILVPTSNEARDVKRRLQKDPKAFEGLAQSMSKGPEAPSGGLMGEFSRGQLPPELEAAAFALAPGETGDVVSTSLGHHVLRVDSRSAAQAPDLEECRHRIRTLLFQQKQERSEREFIAGLLARAKVNHEAAQARPAES
jgi:parvulin-like peptidyl-prolyl isomerase